MNRMVPIRKQSKNMVQNICMPDGIFRHSSKKVNLYREIFIVYL